MNWFERMACRRAAKRYARRLPPVLASRFWVAKTYTPAQVKTALQAAGLGGRYVAVAYAGALTAADYVANAGSYPVVLPYDQARELFDHHKPTSLSGFNPLVMGDGLSDGVPSQGHAHHAHDGD